MTGQDSKTAPRLRQDCAKTAAQTRWRVLHAALSSPRLHIDVTSLARPLSPHGEEPGVARRAETGVSNHEARALGACPVRQQRGSGLILRDARLRRAPQDEGWKAVSIRCAGRGPVPSHHLLQEIER